MTSRALYEQRARVWEAQKALLDNCADRTMSGQEKEALAKMEGELDELDFAIRAQERGDEKRRQYDAPAAEGEQPSTREVENRSHPATPDGPAGTAALRNAAAAARGPGDFVQIAEHERSFDAYLRRGREGMNQDQLALMRQIESRDLSAGTGSAGGFTVPPGFLEKLTTSMKAYGGMLDSSNLIDTSSGQSLVWPTADDTGNVGSIIAENTVVSTQDITFAQKTLAAYMYTSGLVRLSEQLLQDSAFDLTAWLPDRFAERIGRAINAHFTNGTGGGTQPTGFVPNTTVGKVGATGQTTSVQFDDLIDLVYSVDKAYRDTGVFMMNDSSVRVVRKLKDTTGNYLWQESNQDGAPARLLGYPVVVNFDMPVMAANAKSIAFGDFRRGYIIRRVLGVQVKRFDERYADALQKGFMSFARFDGTTDDSRALRLYQNSAT